MDLLGSNPATKGGSHAGDPRLPPPRRLSTELYNCCLHFRAAATVRSYSLSQFLPIGEDVGLVARLPPLEGMGSRLARVTSYG